MKTKKILLSLLCASTALSLAACREKTPEETPTPEVTQTPEVTVTPEDTPTADAPTTGEVEVTSYKAALVYNNGQENGEITSVVDGGKQYFDKPTDPVKEYHSFVGWYTDEALTTPFNFNTEVSANITLYAKWAQAMDNVNTIWDLEAAAKSIDPAANGNVVIPGDGAVTYQGKFTAEANGKTRFEIKSGANAINTQGTSVIVHLSAEGTNNAITVVYKWASSDSGNFVIRNVETNEELCSDASTDSETTKTISNLPAGDYEIVGVITAEKNASLRIYNLSVTESLPQGPTSGIELSAANAPVNFLKGRDFNSTGLAVYLTYENGRQDLLAGDKYTVAGFDKTKAGKQIITVSYQKNATMTYTDTYEVVVWEAKSLEVYDYTYNGTTNHANYIYMGDALVNTDNITVKAVCSAPEVEGSYTFLLSAEECAPNTEATDKIEFTYGDLSAEFAYTRISAVDLSAAESVVVSVDPEATISVSDNNYVFNTIMEAMQFLELAKVADNASISINLKADAVFNEKVEVTLPNIKLSTDFGSEEPSESKMAVIEYGLLAGYAEPGESQIYSTDGSATFSIRKTAENFTAYGVKFINSINTYDEYQVAKTQTTDTQGVAVLVQADKVVFESCYFSGYQDTLYAQIGRQYYNACYIEGHTDFIFGYDATAYFDKCIISSIGAGVDQNNGGYVVATKGKEGMLFGYVFDDCEFTADENTMPGSISLARAWANDMTMMVMNSDISEHYSVEAFGYKTPDNPDTEDIDESKKNLNDRYGNMSSAAFKPANLKEYNNTGEGAITASIEKTCTVVDATEAAKFVPANIFTANNGTVTYSSAWNPVASPATITILNSDDTVVLTNNSFGFVGSACTKAEYEALITADVVPSGKIFGGFYTDKELTQAYDPTKLLAETNTLYVKWDDGDVLNATTVTFETLSGDITTEIKLANGVVTLVGSANKNFEVDNNSKTFIDAEGNEQSSTTRLKTGGSSNKEGRYIIVDLSTYSGEFKLGVNAISSSSGSNRTGQIREGSIDATSICVINALGASVSLSEVTVQGGKVYYITADAGINYYSINITPIQ